MANDDSKMNRPDDGSRPHGLDSIIRPGISRRRMLKLLGASAALAAGLPGLAGCTRKPHRQIVSAAEAPEDSPPGKVRYFASTWTEGPYPYGMLVKTVDGRPIKIDGNPDHPINRGASTAAMQASILSLYDPDRLKGPLMDGRPTTWAAADERIIAALTKAKSVVVMTRANTSGWAERLLLEEFSGSIPGTKRFVHETINDGPRRQACLTLYGCPSVRFIFPRPSTIVSFDCDFLGMDGPALEAVRQFIAGRNIEDQDSTRAEMPRLYAIESAMTATGTRADHRIRLKPSHMGPFALALYDLHLQYPFSHVASDHGQRAIRQIADRFGVPAPVMAGLASDLESRNSVFLAGGHLPTSVHAAMARLNSIQRQGGELCGDYSSFTEDVADPRQIEAALSSGVDVLILLGVNPTYDWPGDTDFRKLIAKAKLSVSHGLYLDETLSACTIALPSNHNLEAWGDANAWSGQLSICQPVTAPFQWLDIRQEQDSLLGWAKPFAGENDFTSRAGNWHDYLRLVWDMILPAGFTGSPESMGLASQPATSQPTTTLPERRPPTDQDLAWERALRIGGKLEELPQPMQPMLNRMGLFPVLNERSTKLAEELAHEGLPSTQPNPEASFELVILPHHAIYDGRFANNAWLQELPDPITKAVWGNFATMSPATATKLGVVEGDFVRVTVGAGERARSVELPVLIQPGTADGVVVTTLGHGRTAGGKVAVEAGGVNVAPLLGRENPDHPRVAFNVKVEKVAAANVAAVRGQENPDTGRITYDVTPMQPADRYPPVRTQTEFNQHGRPIALSGTLAEFRRDPANFVALQRQKLDFHLPKLIDTFPLYDYSKGHKWAMAIDLNACVGCGACVIACQAENNIPVVGRDQCARGRNMHWLRIDCYQDREAGRDENDPAIRFQPMLCQHCDTAPCETVCPVNATAHSPEGLNEMVYNRCVGTRYCQNNCPYKVRRFNFLRWQQFRLRQPVQELAFNPQVTVRSVGVMEKCTFCVQRINAAKFRAFNADQPIADGDIQTACQQACPAGAIVFGDANDPASRVARLRASPRGYRVLEELNTKSNVTYLVRIDNPAVSGYHGAEDAAGNGR